jgi:glycosyltransferase involved in cell wall biosynthesis
MKQVLVVAFDFPPFADSGVYRTLKFVRYLPLHGWRVTVLTADRDMSNLAYLDSALLQQVPADTRVIRAKVISGFHVYRTLGGKRKEGDQSSSHHQQTSTAPTGEKLLARARKLFDTMVIPDSRVGWYPDAVAQGAKMLAEDPPDAIFSTSPRETAHLIAMRLARKFGARWIADFRDPWVGAFFAPKRFWPISAFDAALQRRVVERADAITVAWPKLVDLLRPSEGRASTKHFEVITNGYDGADFDNVTPKRLPGFSLVHTGRFLDPQRTPNALLQALVQMFEEDLSLRAITKLVLVGPKQAFVDAEIARLGLEDSVERTGRLPHPEAIAYMLGASCLFFQNSAAAQGDPSQHEQHFIPGKLFEYIGSNRPILATVQEGSDSDRLLSRCKQAIRVHDAAPSNIAAALRQCLSNDAAAAPVMRPPADPAYQEFDRRHLAGRLARLLQQPD